MAGVHYTSEEVSCWLFVVVYESCSDVSDLCHKIVIIWLLGTSAFDDLVYTLPLQNDLYKSETT